MKARSLEVYSIPALHDRHAWSSPDFDTDPAALDSLSTRTQTQTAAPALPPATGPESSFRPPSSSQQNRKNKKEGKVQKNKNDQRNKQDQKNKKAQKKAFDFSSDGGVFQVPSCGLAHHFQTCSFRGYSLSSPTISSETGTISFTFLGYDVLRGLYLFHAELERTSDPETSVLPLVLRVRQVGEYSMTAAAVNDDTDDSYSRFMPSTGQGNGSGSGTRSRGFVSTCGLGTEGKRGLWIERLRGSMRRLVTVFSVSGIDVGDEEDMFGDVGPGMRELRGHVVHEESSFDLRGETFRGCLCT
jgi:hypothetical protein